MEGINYREFYKYLADYSRIVTEIIPKKKDDRALLFYLSRGIDSTIGYFKRDEIDHFESKKMWKKRCGKNQELYEYMLLVINNLKLESLEVLEDSMNQWVASLRQHLDIEIPPVDYLQFKTEETITA